MDMQRLEAPWGFDAKLLTVRDSAKLLGISEYTCRKAIRRGNIPSVRFGRLIRVPAWQLRKLVYGWPTESSPEAVG